jgi:hypothetical protein
METQHQQRNNDFLIVVSTVQHGARTLVSGVEKIDTSPEDPIVHLSSPVPGRGISGRDPLLVVSFVTSRKIFQIKFVCCFVFLLTSSAYFLAYFQPRNYFIKNPIFFLLKYPAIIKATPLFS